MTSPAAPTPSPLLGVARGIAGCGLLCVAIVTLASPGATRMHAWPWSLAYAGALLAPAIMLILRAIDRDKPLVLPSVGWRIGAVATAAIIALSAAASPYRGPSVLWSAPLLAALAVFFVVHDSVHSSPSIASRLPAAVGLGLGLIVVVSVALWVPGTIGRPLDDIANGRNPFPLGHANYTAGLALLTLPWLATLAWRAHGTARIGWGMATGFACLMGLGSGSRAGLAGLAALVAAALALAPFSLRRKLAVAAGLLAVGVGLALVHPRTRTLFAPADPMAAPNTSNVQRAAMLTAATRMGTDRPLLGWGPGTTPLAYPRYRAGLDGGAETVLQLHSTPAQLWAELGAAGLVCAVVFAGLALRSARRHPLAFVTLAGYAVFSVGDWQLDVPIFGFVLALCAALLAPPAETSRAPARFFLGATALLSLGLVALLGRPDPLPEMNLTALTLARDPRRADEAIALLRQSIARNPHQEIAHFNLGWLLLVRDAPAAETHFIAAAHLVPDKGGVYFGLGLARLNQGHLAAAARAFALEGLNDPRFLSSPWWSEPALAAAREPTAREFATLVILAQKRIPAPSWSASQLARVSNVTLSAPADGGRAYFRERTAYPILMRNLDLAPPTDLYQVREAGTAPRDLPPKGWLPSPLLLELLDAPPRQG